MPDHEPRYGLHPQAAHRAVAGEVFVVTGDRAFHRLSVPTAVELFEALARGACRRADLVELLLERYQVTREQAETDVTAFLQVLLERQVVIETHEAGP